MKLVVYSAVYGPRDYCPTFKNPPSGFDCVLFTDDIALAEYLTSRKLPWKIRLVAASATDPARASRVFKLKPHEYFPEYDASMWVDGNMELLADPLAVAKQELGENGPAQINFAAYEHFSGVRDAFQCASRCISMKKGNAKEIKQQIGEYRDVGYSEDESICAAGILIRRHNIPAVVEFDNFWWLQVKMYSCRDQISWAYSRWYYSWRQGIDYSWIKTPFREFVNIGAHQTR